MNFPPKGRKSSLVVQELNNEIMIYDITENKALCLNETSAIVWQACDGNNTISEITLILTEKLGKSANEDLVWLAIEQLKKENLIENSNELRSPFLGMSRRDVIKKVGLGTMIAFPIVASLTAPIGIQAGSCININSTPCTVAGDCCPNSVTPAVSPSCNTVGGAMTCCIGTGTIGLTGACAGNSATCCSRCCAKNNALGNKDTCVVFGSETCA